MLPQSYSIKLYNQNTRKYEYLTEVLAEDRKQAIQKFRKQSGWIDISGTMLFAQPPLCR